MGSLTSQSQLPQSALRAHPSLCILQTLVQTVCFKGVVLEDTAGAMFCKDMFHLEINLLLREGFRGEVWDFCFLFFLLITLNKGLPALCSACIV